MNEFSVFRSFYTEEEALSFMQFLREKGIECLLDKYRPINDKIYVGINYDREYHVMIKSWEFKRANDIVDSEIDHNISQIGEDYYLHSFSNEELMEIIEKPDEWGNQNFLIAKKILTDRGVMLSHTEISQKKNQRLTELERPEKEGNVFIILGYIFAIFLGFIGIFFGLLMMNSKKTLPDGRKVFVYDVRTRNHGKNILIISSILLTLVFLRMIMVS